MKEENSARDMIWLLECGVLALRLKEWVKVRLKFMEGL